MLTLTDALEAGIGSHAIETQQQALLQDLPVKGLAGGGAFEVLGEANAQLCLLEDIQQRLVTAPASVDFRLEFA